MQLGKTEKEWQRRRRLVEAAIRESNAYARTLAVDGVLTREGAEAANAQWQKLSRTLRATLRKEEEAGNGEGDPRTARHGQETS